MRTSKQILEEICAHPERDELRLEYATSCEIKDPDYARYIRTEVEWARPRSPLDASRGSEHVGSRIAHPFREYCYDVTLRRGFVEEIKIDPYIFIDRGSEILDRAPIQRVVFTPKPVPNHLETPLLPTVVPSAVPEVMACPHLARLYSIAFKNTSYQRWWASAIDVDSVLASKYLERLLEFSLPQIDGHSKWTDQQAQDVWKRAFARPEFRKMILIDFLRNPGEDVRIYDDGLERVEEPVGMTEFGRDLERRHGYLPALHLHNSWGDSEYRRMESGAMICSVLRGELPKFPTGAPASDDVYVLPTAKRRVTGYDW